VRPEKGFSKIALPNMISGDFKIRGGNQAQKAADAALAQKTGLGGLTQQQKDEKREMEIYHKRPILSDESGLPEKTLLNVPGEQMVWQLPPLSMLDQRSGGQADRGDVKGSAEIIEKTLDSFGIRSKVREVNLGPAVTQYALEIALGTKLSKITSLSNDLALALAAPTGQIRIEAPIPGRGYVGIEIPNRSPELVTMRAMLTSDAMKKAKSKLCVPLGLNVSGEAVVTDIAKMPHLLIAGATGSGKSVCIHSLITSLLWRNGPAILKLILIDPKRVELAYYKDIPHLLTPVINDGKRAINALRWAVKDMERRYEQLSGEGFRDIIGFNNHAAKNGEELMPYIVIVIDELADLMAAWGREVEGTIIRLAQMARAVGIHLVVSTQRPSVEVITGLIKANITTRVAFQVASQVDSRTILDMAGAEKLLGNGDMLYLAGDSSKPKRIQGVYIAEKEIKMITDYIRKNNNSNDEKGDSPQDSLDLTSQQDRSRIAFSPIGSETLDEDGPEDDEMYDEAKRVVIEAQKASASLLQRRLRVGYARAARLLDILEQQGIIGPGDGAKPREVYMKPEQN